jgi:hypothetical protein
MRKKSITLLIVIPAKAGIQGCMHRWRVRLWTPAFAGVTV